MSAKGDFVPKTQTDNSKPSRTSNGSFGIIPSNYAKSHRINSDMPHKVNPASSSPSPDTKAGASKPVLAEKVVPEHMETDAHPLDSDKKNTPKKKNRRGKVTLEIPSPGKAKTADDKNPEGESKPRIVLTFSRTRSHNMKIVSPDEKTNEEVNTRRATRLRGTTQNKNEKNHGIPEQLDSNMSALKLGKIVHDPILDQSESDEAADNNVSPPLKRSARRRSKEFSENVLANAIARKEKSYNETTPTRPSRRIKPTAKALANRELKMGIESQNNARLGIDKSPEEGIQPRRSVHRKTPESRSSGESSKTQETKRQLRKTRKKPSKTLYDSDGDNITGKRHYLSVDDIKNCILESSTPENKTDLKDSQDRENKRFNKLKKKHLSKLGLQAVLGVKRVSNSNENLSDDSTMDSTNTDAIVEHLNVRKKQLEAEKELALQAAAEDDIEMTEETDIEQEEQDEDDDSDTENDSTDEDFEYSGPGRKDVGTTLRVTRKRAKLEQVDNTKDSEHSDSERVDCSSPAGAEGGSAATDPSECARSVASCLCTSVSNIYVAPDTLSEPVFCRAVESVSGTRVGCSHPAGRAADGSYAPLRRPGPRVPYFLVCRLHAAQMDKHLCCPACSLFCTQGTFYQCSEGHLFHLECGLPESLLVGAADDGTEPPGCPHCGIDGEENDAFNRKCSKVKVEMRSSNRRIFLPNQRLQCTPAQMSFTKCATMEPVNRTPIIPKELLPLAPISLRSLRQRGEASTDYEELLTSSAEDRLTEAIVKGMNTEHLITKLISGVDLHQSLDHVDGGTFLHLAAKQGNLTAVYLLHYAGCCIDSPDSILRTPLMVAVSTLVEKPTPVKTERKKHEKTDKNSVTDDDNSQESHKSVMSNNVKDLEGESGGNEDVDEEGIMKVVRYLVAAGCDVNYPGVEGVTALHLAAQHGNLQLCEALLESRHVQVDLRDHGGWTPVVWAAENKHPSIIKLFLKHGADACSIDSEGNSVMHWCALAGCVASMRLLLDSSPHTVNTVNAHSDTPLHVAARQDHYSCVVVLLARGGRTDMKNSSDELPVDCASGESRTAISLNMQMALVARDKPSQHRILSSDISNGREAFPIPCVNEVDDAELPSDFTYITEHVFPHHVRLDHTLANMQGCECATEACGSGASNTCACCLLGVRRWFSEGRLVQAFPYRDPPMLFECNQTCKCNMMRCPNAVVTRLSRHGATFVRAQVYRYGDTRGWGLRTLAPVLRGAPVALYCGELLKTASADTRSKDQYMFAMEVKHDLLEQCEEKAQLCVDAAAYGSASRFINHSCRPNLVPVRVFTQSRDVRLPAIVLFATRIIEPLEELTFNYGDKFWSVKSKFMHCACGAPDCRYPPKTASPAPDR